MAIEPDRSSAEAARQGPGPIRVMVCDDSAVIRGLYTRTLETDPEIRVISSVGDGRMAVASLKRQDVDVIVRGADISGMPRDFPQWIYGGSLSIAAEIWNNEIPIPLDRGEITLLKLELADALTLFVHGRGVLVVTKGEADFCETLPSRTP